jgi:7-carboxy-7-deazaguanine synthase
VRLSELYVSMQGEGPRVGLPTVFVRFGGCNLRCALWPCDTPYAVDPKVYRNEWEQIGIPPMIDRITELSASTGATNVCFTGGEPFLQKEDQLNEVIRSLGAAGYHLEAFTNGTLMYSRTALKYVDMVMDWKLPGSGEDIDNQIRLHENLPRMKNDPRHAIKFTIAGWADFIAAKHIWEDRLKGHPVQVFAGIVWGKMENEELVKWILNHQLPWRYNVQVHNHIWDRSQRAI